MMSTSYCDQFVCICVWEREREREREREIYWFFHSLSLTVECSWTHLTNATQTPVHLPWVLLSLPAPLLPLYESPLNDYSHTHTHVHTHTHTHTEQTWHSLSACSDVTAVAVTARLTNQLKQESQGSHLQCVFYSAQSKQQTTTTQM